MAARIEMRILSLITSCLCFTVACWASTERWTTAGQCHSEFRVIAPSQFTGQNLRAIADAFTSDALKKNYLLSQLVIFADRSDITSFLGTTETSYESVMDRRRQYKHFPIARVVVSNSSAILQVRFADGALQNLILRGENPLLFDVDGQKYEILGVDISKATDFQMKNLGTPVSLTFSIRAIEMVPSAEGAVRIWRYLFSKWHSKNLAFYIRNGFFFANSTFPIDHPFTNAEPPGSAQEYNQAPKTNCFPMESYVRCSSQRGSDATQWVDLPLPQSSKPPVKR